MSNKQILTYLFIFVNVLNFISCKLDTSKVIAAVNCDGNEYIDSNGVRYEAANISMEVHRVSTV